jgi:hypothetical protein
VNGLEVRELLSNPTATITASATSSGAGTVLTAGAGGATSFQPPLYSELLVDQTGTPILAETSTGVYDIIMTVQQI